MMLDWTEFPGAPVPGEVLCALSDVPANGVFSGDVAGFQVLVLLHAGDIVAFVNACPHRFLPLDHRDGDIVSSDQESLICSNHDAMFRLSDGAGISGEGLGCSLSAIPVNVVGGQVQIRATVPSNQ